MQKVDGMYLQDKWDNHPLHPPMAQQHHLVLMAGIFLENWVCNLIIHSRFLHFSNFEMELLLHLEFHQNLLSEVETPDSEQDHSYSVLSVVQQKLSEHASHLHFQLLKLDELKFLSNQCFQCHLY